MISDGAERRLSKHRGRCGGVCALSCALVAAYLIRRTSAPSRRPGGAPRLLGRLLARPVEFCIELYLNNFSDLNGSGLLKG